jgi:RHS repeat-associated protein
LLAYRSDAVTDIDWLTGIMKGAIADKLSDDESYPYSRQVFEKSPLGRVVEIGAPGKNFAITGSGNDHTIKYSYGFNTNEVPALPEKQYYKTKCEDQNGNTNFTLTDKFGTPVSNTIVVKNGTNIQSGGLLNYSPDGKTSVELLPNYFNPPQNSVPTDWQRSTFYNTRGQMLSFTEPNSGTTYFIYNEDGLVRFSQNQEQVAAKLVLYKKYDSENRLAEEGYFTYTGNLADLQSKANNEPNWPGAGESAIPQNRYYYNGDKTNVNDLGNLTQIEVMSKEVTGDIAVLVKHYYNDCQQLAQTEVTQLADNVTFITKNEYDNLGNVKNVTYPSGVKLQYVRDEVGRVTKILDADQKELQEITYTAGDQILTETSKLVEATPVITKYTYNSQGWRVKAESPQMTETIEYTQSGYGAVGYFNGNIASKTVRLNIPEGSNLPNELTYKYSYDEASRIKVAACLVGGTVMDKWSLGLPKPVTYDANGNFLEVNEEKYMYEAGTDFVKNNKGTEKLDFEKDKNGATVKALPRGINHILRDIFSGKPMSIETIENGVLEFIYDERNNRLSKKVNEQAKYYGRNQGGTVLTEKDIAGILINTKEYLYGPGGMFGIKTKEGYHAIQKDHLKSPRIVMDKDGEIISSYQYEPFGSLINPDEIKNEVLNYLFGGYELDAETGLYNTSARLYDPILRRFYSNDPQYQYASPYLFAGNNPMNLVDPDGEASAGGMVAGIVVGTVISVLIGLITFGVGSAISAGATAAAAMATALGGAAVAVGPPISASVLVGIGAVTGIAASIAGDATTARISGEPYTGKQVAIGAVTGLLGGVSGAGAAIGIGRSLAAGITIGIHQLQSNMDAGFNLAARLTTARLVGLAVSVPSKLIANAIFPNPAPATTSTAPTARAASGGALLTAGVQFGWFGGMQTQMKSADFNKIGSMTGIDATSQHLSSRTPSHDYINTKNSIARSFGYQSAIFQGGQGQDIAALNQVGRFVFPYTKKGYTQPITANMFTQYPGSGQPYLNANAYGEGPVPSLKLMVCFGG